MLLFSFSFQIGVNHPHDVARLSSCQFAVQYHNGRSPPACKRRVEQRHIRQTCFLTIGLWASGQQSTCCPDMVWNGCTYDFIWVYGTWVSLCQQLPILPDQSWLHTHALYMIIPKIRNHRTKVYNSDQFMQLETVGRCEELCRRAWQNCYSGPCRTDKSNVACVGIASCRLANLCFQTTPAWIRVRVQRSLTCTHWGALLVGVWIVWTA